MPIEYPTKITHWLSEDAKKQPLNTHEKYPFPGINGLVKPEIQKGTKLTAHLATATTTEKNSKKIPQAMSSSPLHGITRLSVVVGEGKDAILSQPFNNGKGNETKVGRYLQDVDPTSVFCFAPGVDKPKICWKVRNTDKFTQVKFELFCKSDAAPIWEMTWREKELKENKLYQNTLGAGTKSKDGNEIVIQWTGSLDWDKTVKITNDDRFPAGILTVEHSPYQLRMTVNDGAPGEDRKGYPLVAWTYIHILVHDIQLSWGTDNVIPRDRTDIDEKYKDALLESEKRILGDLKKRNLSLSPDGSHLDKTHDVILNATVFDYTESKAFTYFRERWGNGPFIPLFAKATIKKANTTKNNSEGVLLPKALGNVKFLWEWQDNDGESRDIWLQRWIGNKDDKNNKISKITRYYLEEVLKAFQSNQYPYHAFNCPAEAGGKRGRKKPTPQATEKVSISGTNDTTVDYLATHVFPEQSGTGTFAFKVAHEFQKRAWAVVSYVGEVAGSSAQTGVLFQPGAIAGDRYKISVCLIKDGQDTSQDELDIDQLKNKYYDLLDDAQKGHLPFASTRYFAVWRGLQMTYLYGSDFDPTTNSSTQNPIETIKKQIKNQLGHLLDVEVRNFPDLGNYLQSEIDKLIVEEFNTGFQKSLIVRSLFPQLPLPKDDNYAFKTISSNDAWTNLKNYFQTSSLAVLKLKAESSKTLNGKEIVSFDQQKVSAMILHKPDESYSHLENLNIILYLSKGRFQPNQKISIFGENTAAASIEEIKPTSDFFWHTCSGLKIELKLSTALSTTKIKIVLPDCVKGSNNSVEEFVLTIGRNIRSKRVTTNQANQVKEFITKLQQAYPKVFAEHESLSVELYYKSNSDLAKIRAENLQACLKEYILDRLAFFEYQKYVLFQSNRYSHQEVFVTDRSVGLKHILDDKLLPRCLEAALKAKYKDYDLEGRLYFYHLRGISPLDKINTGGFDTGNSTQKTGIGNLIEVKNTTSKRLYKSSLSTMLHELGHGLRISEHAPPRSLEAPLSGAGNEHLCYDACIMNYDAYSEAFCGIDILMKRGWFYAGLVPDLHDPHSSVWRNKCEQLLQQSKDDPAGALHLAWFIYETKKGQKTEDSATKKAVQDAVAIIRTAENSYQPRKGTGEYVWWIRNRIVFYDKVGNKNDAQTLLSDLVSETTTGVDINDLTSQSDANQFQLQVNGNLGSWKSGGDEFDYRINIEIGDINDLFQDDVNTSDGKKARLQVLGLFNRPLKHPESDDCLSFSWKHAKSLFKNLEQNPDAVLSTEIKRFLVGTTDGKLPEQGTAVKIRIPTLTTLYSQYDLMLRFPEWEYSREDGYQEGKQPEEKPYATFGLGSEPLQIEAAIWTDNPAMGKIPLKVHVERRAKNSGTWLDAPDTVVYLELLKPDVLPGYARNKSGFAARHQVAGGFSFYSQAAAPSLETAPETYLNRVKDRIPTLPNNADPQLGNAEASIGGKRNLNFKNGGLTERSIIYEPPFNQNIFEGISAPGQFDELPDCEGAENSPNTVAFKTDSNGIAKVAFMPSRIGGDRYKLKAFVGQPTVSQPEAVVETGTMVRWRTIRVCRYMQMPVHTQQSELPDYLKPEVGKADAPDFLQSPPVLQPVDFQNILTYELAKAYCELIVESAAEQPQPLKNSYQEFKKELDDLLKKHEWQANCTYWERKWNGRDYEPRLNPIKEELKPVINDTSNTQFEAVLSSKKPYLTSLTVRLPGENFDTASIRYSNEDPATMTKEVTLEINSETVTTATFNYDTGKLSITLKSPLQANPKIMVWYHPADYLHVDSLLIPFPDHSPYLFNLNLPATYNQKIRQLPTQIYLPMQSNDNNWDAETDSFWENDGGNPKRISKTSVGQFLNSRITGLIKGLFMLALVRGIGGNQGFYPGLVVIQALSLDNYGDGNQEGKNLGNGIYLFNNTDQKITLHEMAHGLYLQHAPTASGNKPYLHDGRDVCVMSYDNNDGDFCGQCIAALQGMNTWDEPFASAND